MALLDFPSNPVGNATTTQNGNTWKWNGTSWVAFNSLSLTSQVTGILAVDYGGTGFGGTFSVGDILYASSSNTFAKLAAGTAGSVLASGGPSTAPYWKIDAQGTGTVSTGTANEITYYDTTTSVNSATGITLTAGSKLTLGFGTSSTSTTTGAFIVYGGVGIGGSLWTGSSNFSSISGVGHQNGVITSGVWSGTAISLTNGGTNGTRSGNGVSYELAVYNSTGTAITQIATSSSIANSILLQASELSYPTWVSQSALTSGIAISAAQVNLDATTSTRYLIGTPLNTASGSTQLSTGSGITIGNNLLTSGAIAVTNTTGTAATTGGALVVTGGVGIGGSLWTTTSNYSSISGVGHQYGMVTSGAWSGTAISLAYGGTNGTRSGSAISYQVAVYNAAGTSITQIASGTASSVLFQADGGTAPYWVAQSTLVVGGASTAANIQGGAQYQLHYQSAANTTSFVTNAAGAGASILTQTNGSAPVYLPQSQLVVGSATTSSRANAFDVSSASAGTTYYLAGVAVSVGTNAVTAYTSGTGVTFDTTSITATTFRGSLAGLATSATRVGITSNNTNSALPLTFSDVQQPFGALGSTVTISAIAQTGAILANTFIGNLSGAAVTATHYGSGANLTNIVTSATASNGINITGTGSITIGNIGVLSLQGTANQVLVNGGSGSATTGAITLTTPQNIGTGAGVTFANLTLSDGTNSTVATVGSQPTSMVNKQYVDNLASGLDIHGSVRLIQTGSALAANYVQTQGAGVAATGAYLISTTTTALPAIDGITISATGTSQRVLVNGGFTGTASIAGTTPFTPANSNLGNGIYYVASVGTGATYWMLIRATDTDDNVELTGGTFTFVEEGTNYADSGWVCSNDTTNFGPISIGSTAITFTQFTGGGALSVGQGLSKVGNTLAVNANITSAGTNTAGKWDTLALGGALSGVAGTGFYPTFQIKTEAAYTGTGLFTLNNDGFSLTGSTGTNRTLTVTGGNITLTGSGTTLTLTGSISLPSPTANGIAYGATGTTVAFLTAGGSGASVLTQTSGSAPVYLAQSQLVVGGASTAAQWQTSRTVTFSGGGVTGSFSINGTADVSGVTLNVANDAVALGTKTTGQYASTITISGNGITATSAAADDGTAYTIYSSATSANTTSAIVLRDSSGNFSAGTITASLSGLATSATRVGITSSTSNSALPLTFSDVQQPFGALGSTTSISAIAQTGAILATTFIGNLSGVAATVTNFYGTLSGLASSATKINITNLTGSGVSYLYFGDVVSGYGAVGATTLITVTASSGTITATNFSGLATSATRVGITSNNTNSALPLTFSDVQQPFGALGSTVTISAIAQTGAILATTFIGNLSGAAVTGTNVYGSWSGTAISTSKGGTGLATINANELIIGASTGNTFASIGSSFVPVVNIGVNPPASVAGAIGNTQAGQLWWDSTYGVLKIYYNDGNTLQWVDATPVLGSSGGGSASKRSYVLSFGAGFTPSTGPDTISIQIPYAPDNSSANYYIKRLDYRNETASTGAGVSFYIERHTTGNASFAAANRIHSAAGASFIAAGSGGIFITSYTYSSTGASIVSSSGVAGSVVSGDYLRLNFAAINGAATMSVSMIIEEQ